LAERWSFIILRNIVLIGAEICEKHPGRDEDLVVVVSDPVAFARRDLGELEWSDALRGGRAAPPPWPRFRHCTSFCGLAGITIETACVPHRTAE
jgi:hypothetical protein